MYSNARRTVALAVVGLLLVANHVWLFPHDSDVRYTYERSRIGVENGTLTYHGSSGSFSEYNDLNAVGCQFTDADERACVLDSYLVTHGPLTMREPKSDHVGPDFIQLDDGYYRRVHRLSDESTPERLENVTWDVERVTPRDLLAAISANFSGIRPGDLPESASLEHRLAIRGGTTTSFEDPEDDDLGNVYYRNGTYYTVVVTDRTLHNPLPGSVRGLLTLLGAFALLAATVRASRRLEWTDT